MVEEGVFRLFGHAPHRPLAKFLYERFGGFDVHAMIYATLVAHVRACAWLSFKTQTWPRDSRLKSQEKHCRGPVGF
jgi:hypothetical protein